jgi:glutathione synthase/RimK-type ligase-like ATP-grasp enzyme
VTRDELYRRRMSGRSRRSRALPRVALVSCRSLPFGDEDGPVLQAACAAAGLDTEWLVWDDPAVDWTSYDLVVVRSTWDYSPRRDDFVAWAESVPRLANPADVIRWNTDKSYLHDLAAAGIPVVPTTLLEPGDDLGTIVIPPDGGEYVVKPAVGAGGLDTARYAPEHVELARVHARKLLDSGRRVLVQPYLTAVDDLGETALLFCGGRYSHAVRKGPLLTGPDPDVDGLYREEKIDPREPTDAERALAERALGAVPGGPGRLLYARVDLIPGPDGRPLLLELELTEPSFFLADAPGAADRFAAAITARVATPAAR